MFTGIVQGIARVSAVTELAGLRSFTLALPLGFAAGLEVGASVSCDGVCLTVTRVHAGQAPAGPGADVDAGDAADFDVMQQSLNLTTILQWAVGSRVNVERAARDGAEIGGHPLSGHVDVMARIVGIRQPENNHVLRIGVPAASMRYIFAKGYIADNGASLTVAEADRHAGWFEVWLIPETLRMTTFGDKQIGDALNIEIERATQVFVDTVRDTLAERLGPLLPALEAFARERGIDVQGLAAPLPCIEG